MQALQDDGFAAGAVEQWHDADGTEVMIKIYRFATPNQATSWQTFNVRGYGEDATLADQSPVDGIPSSGCFATKKATAAGFMETTGVATNGALYTLVRVYQPQRQNRPVAITIIKSQYDRLP